MITLENAIKIIEKMSSLIYVSCVCEAESEYILYIADKEDDECIDDEAYGVSKKDGTIRELYGEEAFLCEAPEVWIRESKRKKGRFLNERDNDQG